MNKRYPSGKSAGFSVLIWGVLALLAGCCFFVPGSLLPWVILGTALAAALLLWVWFGTWYEFREQYLLLRCGPFFERIPYERITQATPTTAMLSSMALSSRMIELRHGANYITGTTLISPLDREGFLSELRSRCTNLSKSEGYTQQSNQVENGLIKSSDDLVCPHCVRKLTADDLLENSTIAWPNQRWILFKCPTCDNDSHVEVSAYKLSIGYLDGAPGPVFITQSAVTMNDEFLVTSTDEFIECKYKGKQYIFLVRK